MVVLLAEPAGTIKYHHSEKQARQGDRMENRTPPPIKLTDFKGNPPRVEVDRGCKDEADISATKGLLDLYTQPDGFHCPRCGVIIKDIEEAVNHLAEEINKALAHLKR